MSGGNMALEGDIQAGSKERSLRGRVDIAGWLRCEDR